MCDVVGADVSDRAIHRQLWRYHYRREWFHDTPEFRAALDRIPGLSESVTDRLREALASGITGPIVDIDDDGDGVRIVIE